MSPLKDASASERFFSKEYSELVRENINNKVTLQNQAVASTMQVKHLSIKLKHTPTKLEEAKKVEDQHQQKINNLKRKNEETKDQKKKLVIKLVIAKELVQQ